MTTTTSTIAVTGATGHLGNLVIEGLLATEAPSSIVAIVRNAEKAAPLAARGVQIRIAPYSDPAALETALEEVDRLLLISSSEVGNRVEQHTNVVNAAAKAGVGQIVYTSAPHADTTSLILAPEHKATEEVIRASGIPFTFLRNNWYTENYVSSVQQAKQTGTIVAAAGDGRVASATRADYAAAAAAVLTGEGHQNAVYELTGDTAWNFNDLAQVASELIGADVVYKPVTADELITILTGAGLPEGTAQFVAALDASIAEGTLGQASTDLQRLIGRPTTPLLDGLRAALDVA